MQILRLQLLIPPNPQNCGQIVQGSISTRRCISLSIENFVRCGRNAIFCACKISRYFADHPSEVLISKVDKFYTGSTVITHKNRRVHTSSQNSKNFAIRCHKEKHLSTSIKYRRFKKKNFLNLCWPEFYYTLLS